jgi:predicted HicB family RNase H-like nuclease
MDVLKYKGYEGTATLDMRRGVCRGKILLIDDLVTYEADEPKKLQAEFEAAVEDYIETCQQLGRQPQAPLKGLFNVRLSPELHKELVLRAAEDEVTLNETVARACAAYVCGDVNHNHQHAHTHTVTFADSDSTVTRVASGTRPIQWDTGGFSGRH